MDARAYSYLAMRVRAENGIATPNFYLADAATRVPLRAMNLPAINEEWQTIRLPLDHYAAQGIDLSHLDSLQLVFEWEEHSGTIYLDNINFEQQGDVALAGESQRETSP